LDAFCISFLGDTADHRVKDEDADDAAAGALALSLGVIGRRAPSGSVGALSADRLAVPLELEGEEEGDTKEEDDEELCSDELIVGRRNDDNGLSDAGADERPVDGRDGSMLRGLDGGLPAPTLLLGSVPSLDRGDGRVAMGGCCHG
jgi:hypothetical protein